MSDLRERVARAIYEAKRARLLEEFGDTAGWPEWETLKPTLREIQMEECDPYIALVRAEVLEEAAMECERMAKVFAPQQVITDRCAAAIRALKEKKP